MAVLMEKDLTTIETQEQLSRLATLLQRPGEGIAQTFRNIAEMLKMQCTPPEHWGWAYLHQVYHGKLPASKKLKEAINQLYIKSAIYSFPDSEQDADRSTGLPSENIIVSETWLLASPKRPPETEMHPLEQVVVIAPKGAVSPNSYILVSSRHCNLQACKKAFIPSNPNQIYCSKVCRLKARRRARS